MATKILDNENGHVIAEVDFTRSDVVDPTETHEIKLSNGRWIEIHKELSQGEIAHIAAAGFKSVVRRRADDEDEQIRVETDFESRTFERVLTWLVDWNIRDNKGVMPIDRRSLRRLRPALFQEITDALDAYEEEQERIEEAAKKALTAPRDAETARSSAD